MTKLSSTRQLTYAAICMALCVVLPQIFHSIPNAGSVLLPMHLPVLFCGLICGPVYGTLCGLAGPLLSSLITGMPGPAYLPGMMVECALYGLACGLVLAKVRTGKLPWDLYLALLSAMVLGRVAGGLTSALIFAPGEMTLSIWVSSYFIQGIPGILLQLILLPVLCLALTRAGLIPNRYPQEV